MLHFLCSWSLLTPSGRNPWSHLIPELWCFSTRCPSSQGTLAEQLQPRPLPLGCSHADIWLQTAPSGCKTNPPCAGRNVYLYMEHSAPALDSKLSQVTPHWMQLGLGLWSEGWGVLIEQQWIVISWVLLNQLYSVIKWIKSWLMKEN